MDTYVKLKSGTDIRGRAIASEGKPAVLTDKAVADLAAAFALWLSRRTGKSKLKIAVGRDCRLTGEQFLKDIIDVLRPTGQEIFDCGMSSTPAAYLVTQFPSMTADGSIMITASHHPKDINGLKFFTAEGGVNGEQLDEIIALADAGERLPRSTYSVIVKKDCLRLYCDMLTETIRKGTGLFLPLKGMKIVVDAGHGVGGFFATRVLKVLGADISDSQFLEPDGNFPAHAPNPENAEAMQSLKDKVLESGADLGVIFDADADRSSVVAADGTEINRSKLIALAAAIVLPDHPGATIVTDSVTTEGLRVFIEKLGGVQERFRRGYRNVIDEAKRLIGEGVDAPLAIESSGHAAFAEHYFLDDGAYFIAKVLVLLSDLRREGRALTDLISDLHIPPEEADIRLEFTCEEWREKAKTVIDRLTAMSERMLTISGDNYEGVRAYVSHAKGWFIVRTSVHDPVLPIYIESDKKGGCLSIARLLNAFLGSFTGIDCTPLTDFIAEEGEKVREEAEEEPEAEKEFEQAEETVTEPGEEQCASGEYIEDELAEDEFTEADGCEAEPQYGEELGFETDGQGEELAEQPADTELGTEYEQSGTTYEDEDDEQPMDDATDDIDGF